MIYILTFLAALVIGFVIGGLFFRNNAEKLKKAEDTGKHLIDALKGR